MTTPLTFHETIPLSLYIHLPWCVKKCPYCDFNSHEEAEVTNQEARYIDALICDLESALPAIWGRRISSIFIGGGTPSLFSATAIARLLSAIQARLNPYPGIEITLEANPGTADATNFRGYREAGVNRLSLGVQSFNDDKLKQLGRIHNRCEALAAIEMARDAGFDNINIDLMFGLPEQTVVQVISDLKLAIAQAPAHISWYQLSIEPNTLFYSRPPVLPVDDLIWDMQEQGLSLLKQQGYERYEISAYARQDRQCRHNLNYWEFGDYLGIGAGAHSKLTNVAAGRIERFARHKIPLAYMEKAGTSQAVTMSRELSQNEIPLEFFMNSLRLMHGIDARIFLQRTGLPLSVVEQPLQKAEQEKMIEWTVDHIRVTRHGHDFLNELLQLFMPVDE